MTSKGPRIVFPGCRFSSNKNIETELFHKILFKQLGGSGSWHSAFLCRGPGGGGVPFLN